MNFNWLKTAYIRGVRAAYYLIFHHHHHHHLLLLLLRYNSGRVLAFSTISFYLRRSWTCSAHFMFHLSQVVPDVVFPLGLRLSHWSNCRWFPFVYFPYNAGFRHSIYVSKPTHSLGFNIIYYVPMIY